MIPTGLAREIMRGLEEEEKPGGALPGEVGKRSAKWRGSPFLAWHPPSLGFQDRRQFDELRDDLRPLRRGGQIAS